MPEYNLTDEQWCFLDLLMRARAKGMLKLNRLEILGNAVLPVDVVIRLVFAALTMPEELVLIENKHDFSITSAGASLYNLRFSKLREEVLADAVADTVICLPGPGAYLN